MLELRGRSGGNYLAGLCIIYEPAYLGICNLPPTIFLWDTCVPSACVPSLQN